jgi:uncharacterized protein
VILREPAQALDPRVRTLWAVEGAIATVLLAALVVAAVVALAMLGAGTAAVLVAVGGTAMLAAAVVLVLLVPGHNHRHFRFEVTELGLYVARGWWLRRWQLVPHARIETVDINSGPLLRAFGLVSVQVATAAAGGGTGIPGLTPGDADALVEELSRRAGIEAEEA